MENVGFVDSAEAPVQKMEAMGKFKRLQMLKKCVCYLIITLIAAMIMCWSTAFINLEALIPYLYKLQWCSSSRFFILLCNIIILTLLTNINCSSNVSEDLYTEFIKRNESRPKYFAPVQADQERAPPEEIKYICCEGVSGRGEQPKYNCINTHEQLSSNVLQGPAALILQLKKSEPMGICCTEEDRPKPLIYSSSVVVVEPPPADSVEEMMVDEDLRRRSDDFIAKIKSQIRSGV